MCFLNVNAQHHYRWSDGAPAAGALCAGRNFIAIGARALANAARAEPSRVEASQVKSLAKSVGTIPVAFVTYERADPSTQNGCPLVDLWILLMAGVQLASTYGVPNS